MGAHSQNPSSEDAELLKEFSKVFKKKTKQQFFAVAPNLK